jgi:hypothetical protein
MRAAKSSPAPSRGHGRPETRPGAPPKRTAGRKRGRDGPPSRLDPWLRWVPVPLAALVAVIGLLVMGSFQGQVAAANANRTPGYEAGGLALSVTTMLWMSNDMTGQGPLKTGGFTMDPSMMPGIQAVGDNRLRVEVTLNNITPNVEKYSINAFSISGSGKTWPVDSIGHEDVLPSAVLQPGFGTTIDMYFDIPAKQSNHLTLKWSRGGTTLSIPVNTSGALPGPMRM